MILNPILAKEIKIQEINEVFYFEGWEGYPDGNILTFMEYHIPKGNFFIPLFTEGYSKSKNCEKEHQFSILKNIINIPIFEDANHIKRMSKLNLGRYTTSLSPNEIEKNIYKQIQEILRKKESKI